MPGQHRPATTLVALAVLTLALFGLAAGPFVAAAGASPGPSDLAAVPAPARPTAPAPNAGSRVRLLVNSMTPRVVSTTGPGTLTVTGEVVNSGDAPVRDLEIRAQRGDRLRTEGDLRTALAGDASDDAVTPAFTDVVKELAPGQRHPVQLSMPLRGPATSSLALQRGGVYELLLNVNGAPEGGDQVRLAGLRMLLPVLGLPSAPGQPAAPAAAGDTAGGPSAGGATPVTVLYPLADQPRRLPTGPGEPVVLADDQLAAALDRGGRLDGLLGALEAAAPAGSPVRDALCVAVDPDLLRTVSEMAVGYRVRNPDGSEADGRGTRSADAWLKRLRAVTKGRCVVAMPFADADLVALSRAGLDDLARYASRDGVRIASEVLDTPVRTDTVWPADGLLDERSLGDYVDDGGRAVVLSADAVAVSGRSSRGTTGGTVRLPNAVTGLLADPLVTLAASGSESGGTVTSPDVGTGRSGRRAGLPTGANVSPAGGGGTLSTQDTIGAVAFRALSPASNGSGQGQTPLLIAPPHRWNTSGADAGELLGAVGALIAAGQLAPAPLASGTASGSGSGSGSGSESGSGATGDVPAATLLYPLRAGAREVPGTVTARLRAARNLSDELRATAEPRPAYGATPAQVFDPVTEGLLRAGSAVWRGQPALAEQTTKVITERVQLLRSLVRVLEPPSPYSLGAEEAPLPITLANGLPVEMRVRVVLSDTPGLRTERIADVRIPPMGRLQLRVNAQLTRSGQFSVEARLATLNGVPLGVPSRLLLRSTAYGTITLWLTGTAGVLLVILAVRRITRRTRGNGVGRGVPGTPPTGRPRTSPVVQETPPGTKRAPGPPATRQTPKPARQTSPTDSEATSPVEPAVPRPAARSVPVAQLGPPTPARGKPEPRRNGIQRARPPVSPPGGRPSVPPLPTTPRGTPPATPTAPRLPMPPPHVPAAPTAQTPDPRAPHARKPRPAGRSRNGLPNPPADEPTTPTTPAEPTRPTEPPRTPPRTPRR